MTGASRWSRDAEARWQHIVEQFGLYRDALAYQGSLSSRLASGRRVWSLRFIVEIDGRRVQKAIYLGDDPILVQRTQGLLTTLRLSGRHRRSPTELQQELLVNLGILEGNLGPR